MPRPSTRFLRTAFLAAVLAAPAAANALGLEDGNVVDRTSGGIELSGIAWAGGDIYYAVNAANVSNRLYKFAISLDSSGQISSNGVVSDVTLESSSYLEGCAYDPASGTVWVSMEGPNSSIREYDPETGAWLRTAPLPDIFKNNMRVNFRLEALTISGDGLTMWTANEEALACDGNISTNYPSRAEGGTTVRLQRFTRASVRDNWTAAAQYAYKTYGLYTPYGYNNAQRSGVAGLCALPDGQLLVLEREFSGVEENSNLSSIWAGYYSSYTMAIVLADCSSATDVSTLPSLAGATYTPVAKTKLFEKKTGYANYEGICLGPSISDDCVSILLVSDGGGNSMVEQNIMSKVLTGIDVRTLYVEDAANPESVGGPYRHVRGSTAAVSHPGAGNPYEADLRVRPSWTTSFHSSGEGSVATFPIVADDTLRWFATTNTGLSLLATDSFERYAPDTGPAAMEGWSGAGIVRAEECPRPTPAGYPLERDTHTRVFVVDGDATRDYPAVAGSPGALLDMMARVTIENADNPVEDADGQIALHFGEDGRPVLQHRTADGSARTRTALSSRAFADGDWVRVSLRFDRADASGATWCQVRIDGEPCVTDAGVRSPADPRSPGSWYRTLGAAASAVRVSRLRLGGSGAVDDVALYDASGAFEFKDAEATTNGVPCTWLADRGLSWDTTVDLDGDAYDSRAEFAAGTDPLDEGNYFRIVGTDFDDLGRFRIRFLGSAPLENYLVYAGDDLSVPETDWSLASGETVRSGQGTNLWTQAEAPADGEDSGFFRVRATLPQ